MNRLLLLTLLLLFVVSCGSSSNSVTDAAFDASAQVDTNVGADQTASGTDQLQNKEDTAAQPDLVQADTATQPDLVQADTATLPDLLSTDSADLLDAGEFDGQDGAVGVDSADLSLPDVDSPDLTQTPDQLAADQTEKPQAVIIDGRPEEKLEAPNSKIDLFVRGQMDSQKLVGVAIGVVQGDTITYLKGYGYQDLENKIPVFSTVTMFRWASIAKSVAAVVGLRLHEKKSFDVEKSISTWYTGYKTPTSYLEGCNGQTEKLVNGKTYSCSGGFFEFPLPAGKKTITGRLLMGHLAGIPHYSNGKGSPSPPTLFADNQNINTGIEWAMDYLLDKPLVSIPGMAYNYSTFGFNLLGVVLEKAAKTSFAQLIETQIRVPAGLKTLQTDYKWVSIADRAVGYKLDGNQKFIKTGNNDVSWKLPGGGLISTVEDLALYCRALIQKDTLLSDEMKLLAWTRQKTSDGTEIKYGMGFRVWYRGNREYAEHSGSQQKAKTRLRLYIDDDLCIVVMTNSENGDTYELVRGIEDQVRSN